MFLYSFPNFGKGRILKKEMLENLRDFPRDFFSVYFKDYSNGIVSGADVCIGGSEITVRRGIVKHRDSIYILDKDFEMPYYPTNKEVLIKIKFLEGGIDGDFNVSKSKILLDDNTEVSDDELELGRFKLREGAQLRSDYRNFEDFSTEFNTVNIINVEYTGLNKSTISPVILKYFSREALKYKLENPYDVAFVMQCINESLVNRDVILYYISYRKGMDFKDYSNAQIYKYLTMILRDIESGGKIRTDARQNKPSRMIVD